MIVDEDVKKAARIPVVDIVTATLEPLS